MSERGPIIAALIWYNQKPERLYRCVNSLQDVCDGVVALDGPFAGLEGPLCSPSEQYEAIADAADDGGILHWLYECHEPWRGEPEKRTAAARTALTMTSRINRDHPEQPWVLVLDSDEWLLTGLDWSNVLPLGHGTARIHAYRGDTHAPGQAGDGSRMVRLMPNTPTLQWGPAHFDVRDLSLGKTYSGWEKALTNEDEPCVTIGHDLGEKIIKEEYDAYNDQRRLKAEGKMMRVVEDYTNSDRIVVRMDEESAATQDWGVGMVVSFPGALLGVPEETGYAEVNSVTPTENVDGAVDIAMLHVPEEEAQGLIRKRAAVELAKRDARDHALARRVNKRARKADKRGRTSR